MAVKVSDSDPESGDTSRVIPTCWPGAAPGSTATSTHANTELQRVVAPRGMGELYQSFVEVRRRDWVADRRSL
jgi:hypothetical protein